MTGEGAAAVRRARNHLEGEQVLLLEFGFRRVDVHKDLVDQRLKLKFRMHGITYWKSEPGKAAMNGKEHPCLSLNSAARVVVEGAGALEFELCRPGRMASSAVLASGRVPLRQALQSADVDSTHASVWNLELWATGSPNKVLGSLAVDVSIRTGKLRDAGGIAALKAMAVPTPPMGGMESTREKAFIEKAGAAQKSLQEAFNMALRTRTRPEGHARVALPKIKVEPKCYTSESLPELEEDSGSGGLDTATLSKIKVEPRCYTSESLPELEEDSDGESLGIATPHKIRDEPRFFTLDSLPQLHEDAGGATMTKVEPRCCTFESLPELEEDAGGDGLAIATRLKIKVEPRCCTFESLPELEDDACSEGLAIATRPKIKVEPRCLTLESLPELEEDAGGEGLAIATWPKSSFESLPELEENSGREGLDIATPPKIKVEPRCWTFITIPKLEENVGNEGLGTATPLDLVGGRSISYP